MQPLLLVLGLCTTVNHLLPEPKNIQWEKNQHVSCWENFWYSLAPTKISLQPFTHQKKNTKIKRTQNLEVWKMVFLFMSGSLLALMWVFRGVVFGVFLPHKNQYVKSNITGLSHSTPPSVYMGIMWNFHAPEKNISFLNEFDHSCHLQKSRNFPRKIRGEEFSSETTKLGRWSRESMVLHYSFQFPFKVKTMLLQMKF